MERRSIAIEGMVQGVGFRPFVHGLADRLGLGGFVRNQGGGVEIEVEGEPAPLEQFLDDVVHRAPPLAHIDGVTWKARPPQGDRGFRIEASAHDLGGSIVIVPDVATCDACLGELFDPRNRRYRYPFINCTNCGPRLTIVTGAPYDRPRTTMADFAMCPACRAEYEDPADRRFHAQPVACAVCGPRLALHDAQGQPIAAADPLGATAAALLGGKIVAIKGLGGYHLACLATNADAVATLRRRKHRDDKPFAVMVRDVEGAGQWCEVDALERELLISPRRPIVLLRERGSGTASAAVLTAQSAVPGISPVACACQDTADCAVRTAALAVPLVLSPAVAPGNPRLGVMLPYTPLHHLLLNAVSGQPLVMTSGNRSDEPIAYDEPDALDRLGPITDLFLVHDRPIHVRCDDSVTRIVGGAESPIRRSRGYAPQPIRLPVPCPAPILAVGGQLKATFALGSGRRAILSQHMGDLDHLEAYRAFERDIALFEQLFSIQPAVLAHDLHPDYASTRYALRRAAQSGVRLVAVQHHHAHMASCMAEHALEGPVIGVTFDGTGLGTDGAIWGGEFLAGGYRDFERVAHLRYVAMPGGEVAVREPWRMAAAHLMDAQASCTAFEQHVPAASLRTVRTMIEKQFNAPPTSSAGRLFDAVASLAGVRDLTTYEGHAAMELEALATTVSEDGDYPFEIARGSVTHRSGTASGAVLTAQSAVSSPSQAMCAYQDTADSAVRTAALAVPLVIDTRPIIRAVAQDVNSGVTPARIARRFHSSLAAIIGAVCIELREINRINAVALSGGVFMNALLAEDTFRRLQQGGFEVYRHEKVPPNDGGLSLGQLAVAAAQRIEA